MSGLSVTPAADEQRFGFGANWRSFLRVLDDERIAVAEQSLRDLLGVDSLAGKSFLDLGCGSGLFSLAAARLGAARVLSVDYDPESVACAATLRERYPPDGAQWTVERGDALDNAYLASLGQWDVVYSWGVLHHTGDMWRALGYAGDLTRRGGALAIAIYNDQGRLSRLWLGVKRLYNRGRLGRWVVLAVFVPLFAVLTALADVLRGRNPLAQHRAYRSRRGMSRYHDWLDWLGGYPFEVAAPEAVFRFFRDRGFALRNLTTVGGRLGCNQFVFIRRETPVA